MFIDVIQNEYTHYLETTVSIRYCSQYFEIEHPNENLKCSVVAAFQK